MKNKPNVTLSVALVLFVACFLILRKGAGESLSMALAVSVLALFVSFSRLIRARAKFQQTEEGREQYKKNVIRGLILAPILTGIFFVVLVLMTLKMT